MQLNIDALIVTIQLIKNVFINELNPLLLLDLQGIEIRYYWGPSDQ